MNDKVRKTDDVLDTDPRSLMATEALGGDSWQSHRLEGSEPAKEAFDSASKKRIKQQQETV